MLRMAIPVVVSCPCGEKVRCNAGDEVRCPSCGRRHSTEGVALDQVRAAASVITRHRLAARMGAGVVGLIGLTCFLRFGVYGMWIGAALGALLYYGVVLPFWRRRLVAGLSASERPR